MKSTTYNYYTHQLSNRELEILRLISFEYTSLEIGKELFISVPTVETHRRNIMGKLGARNAAGMVRRGIENGLLSFVQQAV